MYHDPAFQCMRKQREDSRLSALRANHEPCWSASRHLAVYPSTCSHPCHAALPVCILLLPGLCAADLSRSLSLTLSLSLNAQGPDLRMRALVLEACKLTGRSPALVAALTDADGDGILDGVDDFLDLGNTKFIDRNV